MRKGPSTRSGRASRVAPRRGWRRGLPACPRRGSRKTWSFREPPTPQYSDKSVRDQDRKHKHPQPDGRRVTEIEEAEGRLVEPYGDNLGRVARSAVGGDRDDVEVANGVHRTDEQGHYDHARNGGRDDVA